MQQPSLLRYSRHAKHAAQADGHNACMQAMPCVSAAEYLMIKDLACLSYEIGVEVQVPYTACQAFAWVLFP